ncbi:MAG: hypothetical protein IKT50_04685 [Clostridia bacterium]|nr:hypothetical protein [Clostridia bacterium]
MDQTEKLLQTSYKTARMGAQAIGAVLPKTEDREMRNRLVAHLSEYDDLSEQTSQELMKRGEEPKENMLTEAMSDIAIQIKAGMDKEPTKLAEMLMNGAVMGIVENTRAMKIYPEAQPVSLDLAGKVTNLCQTVFDDMKTFL